MRRNLIKSFKFSLSTAILGITFLMSAVTSVWSGTASDIFPAQDQKPQFMKTGPKTYPGALDPQSLQLMNKFYDRLAGAQDAQSASMLEDAIEIMWARSGSDTVDLLMARSLEAVKKQAPELAIKLLDSVTEMAPSYTEGWNRKAYVHFSQKQYNMALHDLRQALALDPRHFKAIDGLANVMREIGDKKRALQIYRTLLKVHPFWHGIKPVIEELKREVEGQRI